MRFEDLTFAYGEKTIFSRFSLSLPDQSITAVLGDSGVGKTTLLHLMAGLLTPAQGIVPEARVSYMFQEPRLLPTRSVLRNLTVLPGVDEPTARHWLTAVGLADSMDLLPHQLSGGMAQRVSMARAFATPSDVLLMDEPFKGLDVSLQARLHEVFMSLWRDTLRTTVLVTHDPDEAVAVAHHVVVLRHTPAEVVYAADVTEATRQEVRGAVRAALLAE